MNHTHLLILLGVLAWSGLCAVTLLLRAFVLHRNEMGTTISDGITGPWSWYEVTGFATLIAAFVRLGSLIPFAWCLLAYLIAAALVVVVVSDRWRPWLLKRFPRTTSAGWERAHLTGAGTAFVTAFVLEIYLAWTAPTLVAKVVLGALAAAYALSVGLTRYRWPRRTNWQEWSAAIPVVLYYGAWSLLT